jgi:eukaryotic-like serine/threonine-protein kinase
LKQALVPPDHLNTRLTSGVGEIIEVAMAKDREERYSSTEEMLEDLRAVRASNPPIHARRAVDLDSLADIEETGKTVDIIAQPLSPWAELMNSSLGMTVLTIGGVAVIMDVIFIAVFLLKH